MPLGILAYANQSPIGWCSVAPNTEFPRFQNNQSDNFHNAKTKWSIVCLYVEERFRRNGVSYALVSEAVKFSVSKGAKEVGVYPIKTDKEFRGLSTAFTGFIKPFKDARFVEIGRRNNTHSTVRFEYSEKSRKDTVKNRVTRP